MAPVDCPVAAVPTVLELALCSELVPVRLGHKMLLGLELPPTLTSPLQRSNHSSVPITRNLLLKNLFLAS